jgi:hypothetical protein
VLRSKRSIAEQGLLVLTSWSVFLLEELIATQIVKEFPAFM